MSSTLEILSPADDPALLTPEELRRAIGLAEDDTSQDQELVALGLEASEWVATICGLRAAGGHPPTFKAEGIRETFNSHRYVASDLVLARRFLSEVTVTEGGMELLPDVDFIVRDDQGIIVRLASGFPCAWWAAPLVVEYVAGFGAGSPPTAIPALLKAATSDYVRIRTTSLSIDNPMVRSETTVDLDSVTYRTDADSLDSLEDATRSRLRRFITGTPG